MERERGKANKKVRRGRGQKTIQKLMSGEKGGEVYYYFEMESNLNWTQIHDHSYKILIIGGSGSGEKKHYLTW